MDAFNHRQIMPCVLTGVSNPDIRTEIFGIKLQTPVIMAPCAAYGLAHIGGARVSFVWVHE